MWAKVFEHNGGAYEVSNRIVDGDWSVYIKWDLRGDLVRHLCGYWCLSLTLESIGPGPEYRFQSEDIRFDGCHGPFYYRFKIPGGKIKVHDCASLYLACVSLVSKDTCKDPGHIRGFCEIGKLMFVRPEADHPPYRDAETPEDALEAPAAEADASLDTEAA